MGKNLAQSKVTFYFCDGGSCRKAGSEAAIRTARAHLRNKGLWDESHTIKTRCNGRCEDAPTWIIQSGDYWYKEVDPEKAIRIIDAHCDHQQPLASELIFREGQKKVNSEKERPPLATPVFQRAQDAALGEVYKARGFHSDQYLYAFFLFLQENPGDTKLFLPDGTSFPFSDLQFVDYTDMYRIRLHFGKNEKAVVELVIALVPKTEPDELIKRRITVCEHLIQIATDRKVIRLKDKMGRWVTSLQIAAVDEKIWEYCLKIQLNNAVAPKITLGV